MSIEVTPESPGSTNCSVSSLCIAEERTFFDLAREVLPVTHETNSIGDNDEDDFASEDALFEAELVHQLHSELSGYSLVSAKGLRQSFRFISLPLRVAAAYVCHSSPFAATNSVYPSSWPIPFYRKVQILRSGCKNMLRHPKAGRILDWCNKDNDVHPSLFLWRGKVEMSCVTSVMTSVQTNDDNRVRDLPMREHKSSRLSKLEFLWPKKLTPELLTGDIPEHLGLFCKRSFDLKGSRIQKNYKIVRDRDIPSILASSCREWLRQDKESSEFLSCRQQNSLDSWSKYLRVTKKSFGIICFLHGGGFVRGQPKCYYNFLSDLLVSTSEGDINSENPSCQKHLKDEVYLVAALNYRKAPEEGRTVPTLVEECIDFYFYMLKIFMNIDISSILEWIEVTCANLENSMDRRMLVAELAKFNAEKLFLSEYTGFPRISVMGDSAGGNLASQLTFSIKKVLNHVRKNVPRVLQYLACPRQPSQPHQYSNSEISITVEFFKYFESISLTMLPKNLILLSPWVDLSRSLFRILSESDNARFDYLHPEVVERGAKLVGGHSDLCTFRNYRFSPLFENLDQVFLSFQCEGATFLECFLRLLLEAGTGTGVAFTVESRGTAKVSAESWIRQTFPLLSGQTFQDVRILISLGDLEVLKPQILEFHEKLARKFASNVRLRTFYLNQCSSVVQGAVEGAASNNFTLLQQPDQVHVFQVMMGKEVPGAAQTRHMIYSFLRQA